MSLRCGWAGSDENGNASGGQLGDQTGKEVRVGKYYSFGQSIIYRFKDVNLAVQYANKIEQVCLNNKVGYDQSNRTTLYKEAKKKDYDMTAITTPCACDCSSLVACCLIAVGVDVPYTMTTSTLGSHLAKLDVFEQITDSNALKGEGLQAGDIVNASGRHVITVLNQDGIVPEEIDKSTLITSNEYLSQTQMLPNAKYIYRWLHNKGWTDNAIAGVFGSLEEESTFNPGIWQGLKEGNLSGGFGLVQWTPATNLIDWANANGLDYLDIDTQLMRIEWERENRVQYYPTANYPESFNEFIVSTKTPEYLAIAWVANYERPKNPEQSGRGVIARKWYDKITRENWSNGVNFPDTDIPDINDPTGEAAVYEAIRQTPFNMKSLPSAHINLLKSLSFGDIVYMKFTFNRRKSIIGHNIFGKRLTFDNKPYTIKNVSSNGFLILSYNNSKNYKIIHPNYIENKGVQHDEGRT